MKALRLAALALVRDGRSGELGVLLLALLVAVSALTAVGFFTSRVSRAVDRQAGEVIAADLRVRSPNPIERAYLQMAEKQQIRTAEQSSFPSVILHGEDTALAAIRAVSPSYPLRGKVKVADAAFGKGYEVDAMPGAFEVWPESRLLAQLNAKVGDRVTIGAAWTPRRCWPATSRGCGCPRRPAATSRRPSTWLTSLRRSTISSVSTRSYGGWRTARSRRSADLSRRLAPG